MIERYMSTFMRSSFRTPLNFKVLRSLSVLEYQSMDILRSYNVNVPKCFLAHNKEEAFKYGSEIVKGGSRDLVVKAQVLTGGRGKGSFDNGFSSGVHLVFDVEQAVNVASKMIGHNLITKQTGIKGLPCNKVLISERLYSRKEFYLAFMLDRTAVGPLLIGSSQGGVNIEEIAHNNPDAIVKLPVDFNKGIDDLQVIDFLRKISFTDDLIPQALDQVKRLYKVFLENDCTLLEINPFCETNDGQIACVDCKLQIDDNALYRHETLANMVDNSQVDLREVEAAKYNLNYIGLEGNIGCLVNGAGLAMATLDIIKLHGGNPANFLDIGGGANAETVTEALRIITEDKNVKAILINIFGGIMRCDVIAEGVIEAARKHNLSMPIVLRLQGTNVDEARATVVSSSLRIMLMEDLNRAAKLVTNLARIVELAQDESLHVNFEIPI